MKDKIDKICLPAIQQILSYTKMRIEVTLCYDKDEVTDPLREKTRVRGIFMRAVEQVLRDKQLHPEIKQHDIRVEIE